LQDRIGRAFSRYRDGVPRVKGTTQRPRGDYETRNMSFTAGTLAEIDRRRGRESSSGYVERLLRECWKREDFARPQPSRVDPGMREFFGVPA